MVIAGERYRGACNSGATKIDDDQKAGAALDAFYGGGAGCRRRVKVDRAAGVVVLCRLHGSHSLVRGVRTNNTRLFVFWSTGKFVMSTADNKKPALRGLLLLVWQSA